MTTPTMALAELAEKGADVDVLRQMVQFMAQRLMEIDVESRCGAGYDEKAPGGRLNSCNGYRERTWDMRAGAINLKIPKPRFGSYFPPFLHRAAAPPGRATARCWLRHHFRPCCSPAWRAFEALSSPKRSKINPRSH